MMFFDSFLHMPNIILMIAMIPKIMLVPKTIGTCSSLINNMMSLKSLSQIRYMIPQKAHKKIDIISTADTITKC